MFLMRAKYRKLGGHTHVQFFCGFGDKMVEERFSNLGENGTLTFRNEEWEQFRDIITRPGPVAPPFYKVEVVDEAREHEEISSEDVGKLSDVLKGH